FQLPAHVVRLWPEHSSGLPEQEVRVGIERIRTCLGGSIHSGEAWLAIGPIPSSQRLSAIDPDVGVVYDPLVAGPQLDPANILRLSQVDWDDKIAKHITAACPQAIGLGHLHNQ